MCASYRMVRLADDPPADRWLRTTGPRSAVPWSPMSVAVDIDALSDRLAEYGAQRLPRHRGRRRLAARHLDRGRARRRPARAPGRQADRLQPQRPGRGHAAVAGTAAALRTACSSTSPPPSRSRPGRAPSAPTRRSCTAWPGRRATGPPVWRSTRRPDPPAADRHRRPRPRPLRRALSLAPMGMQDGGLVRRARQLAPLAALAGAAAAGAALPAASPAHRPHQPRAIARRAPDPARPTPGRGVGRTALDRPRTVARGGTGPGRRADGRPAAAHPSRRRVRGTHRCDRPAQRRCGRRRPQRRPPRASRLRPQPWAPSPTSPPGVRATGASDPER